MTDARKRSLILGLLSWLRSDRYHKDSFPKPRAGLPNLRCSDRLRPPILLIANLSRPIHHWWRMSIQYSCSLKVCWTQLRYNCEAADTGRADVARRAASLTETHSSRGALTWRVQLKFESWRWQSWTDFDLTGWKNWLCSWKVCQSLARLSELQSSWMTKSARTHRLICLGCRSYVAPGIFPQFHGGLQSDRRKSAVFLFTITFHRDIFLPWTAWRPDWCTTASIHSNARLRGLRLFPTVLIGPLCVCVCVCGAVYISLWPLSLTKPPSCRPTAASRTTVPNHPADNWKTQPTNSRRRWPIASNSQISCTRNRNFGQRRRPRPSSEYELYLSEYDLLYLPLVVLDTRCAVWYCTCMLTWATDLWCRKATTQKMCTCLWLWASRANPCYIHISLGTSSGFARLSSFWCCPVNR